MHASGNCWGRIGIAQEPSHLKQRIARLTTIKQMYRLVIGEGRRLQLFRAIDARILHNTGMFAFFCGELPVILTIGE
jgi:hypothetical protein